jgi:trehalose 6-phosphate synthase
MSLERAILGLLAVLGLSGFLALGSAFSGAIGGDSAENAAGAPIADGSAGDGFAGDGIARDSAPAPMSAQAGAISSAAHLAGDLAGGAQDLVIASNRGPINWAEEGGLLVPKRAGGGLATGLAPIVENNPRATWVASAVDGADFKAAQSGTEAPGFRMRYVSMDPARYDLAYNEIANRVLWYFNHGFWDGVHSPRFGDEFAPAWAAFRELNDRFAAAISDVAPEGGKVLVQDYHLPLVGKTLREARPDLTTIHFSHTPFGGPDDIRRIPDAAQVELLEGMAGFDAAGFHTDRWARRYTQTSEETIGRAADTYVAPLGIEPDAVRRVAFSPEANEWVAKLKARVGNRFVFARTDRMELSKGIENSLDAYDKLLTEHPELSGKVTFIAALFPSRGGIGDYAAYADSVRAKVGAINAKHTHAADTADHRTLLLDQSTYHRDLEDLAGTRWEPIILLDDQNNQARAFAALRIADGVVINPVRDGLNLVAKEAMLINERAASLLLSPETGFYDELLAAGAQGHVQRVNPWDIASTAEQMHQAITKPKLARVQNARALRKFVESRGPRDWLADQLNAAN